MRPRSTPFSLDQDTERSFGPMSDDCRLWKWSQYPNGYGRIKLRGRATTAHRVFFELHKGRVPDGMVLDHLCDRKLCCNPDHLDVVKQIENVYRDWQRKGKRWGR